MTALGLVFSNIHDQNIPELTRMRTMASAPIGCRYRLIDFVLSNMVNSSITKVGIITHNNSTVSYIINSITADYCINNTVAHRNCRLCKTRYYTIGNFNIRGIVYLNCSVDKYSLIKGYNLCLSIF